MLGNVQACVVKVVCLKPRQSSFMPSLDFLKLPFLNPFKFMPGTDDLLRDMPIQGKQHVASSVSPEAKRYCG